MAKDDYDVIVFKTLTCLYGVMKRKYNFEDITFQATISKKEIVEEYLLDVLYMMQNEDLVKGLTFARAWGDNVLLANSLSDMRITATGIRHLTDTIKMKQVKEVLLNDRSKMVGHSTVLTDQRNPGTIILLAYANKGRRG